MIIQKKTVLYALTMVACVHTQPALSQNNASPKHLSLSSLSAYAGTKGKALEDSIAVRSAKIEGSLHLLDCINGFGGGNVAASVGEDGILLVDDMYSSMHPKLKEALKGISNSPVRIVLNTHFHRDHIEGNKNWRTNAVIIGHENLRKRLVRNNKETAPTLEMLPSVTFTDSLRLHFNGEEILMMHFPSSHTDGDAAVYFKQSKTLHLGDMFFFEMFPAVYTEGGGNIMQLIKSLEQIEKMFPADTHVIPGHGRLATMKDLQAYITMLKETTGLVSAAISKGTTLEQMKAAKLLAKYDALGEGGAQTTEQYLGMLYKLLK